MATNAREFDPGIGFQFSLIVRDMVGYFTEVSGMNSENAVATHKVAVNNGEGEPKEITIQVPGRVEWGEITFKRGLTGDTGFWTWRQEVIAGNLEGGAREEVTINLHSRDYADVLMSWTLVNAWPSKLSGPSLAADSNDFAIEELSLVHEGLFTAEAGDLAAMVPAVAGQG